MQSKSNAFFAAFFVFCSLSIVGAQTGGNFTITQSAIVSGGAGSGGVFSVQSTSGQPIAAATSTPNFTASQRKRG